MSHPHVNGTGMSAAIKEAKRRSKAAVEEKMNDTASPTPATVTDEINKLVDTNAKLSAELEAMKKFAGERAQADEQKVIANIEDRERKRATLRDAAVRRRFEWAESVRDNAHMIWENAALFGETQIGIAAVDLEREAVRVVNLMNVQMAADRLVHK